MSHPDPAQVRGALVAAARDGVLDPMTIPLLEYADAEPCQELTQDAWALARRLPHYGELAHLASHWEWTSFWDGRPAVTFRQPLLQDTLEEALGSAPQHLWAQHHLAPVLAFVGGVGDPEAAAMLMDEGPDGGPLRVSAEEQVDVPSGLAKVVLFPASDAAVEGSREDGFPPIALGSLATRQGEEIAYAPLPLVRMEVPAAGVPTLVAWSKAASWVREEEWAAPAVLACNDASSPLIATEGASSKRALAILPHPIEQWDADLRAHFEAFLVGAP